MLTALGDAAGIGATAIYAHAKHWNTVVPPVAWTGELGAAHRRHRGPAPRGGAVRMSPLPSALDGIGQQTIGKQAAPTHLDPEAARRPEHGHVPPPRVGGLATDPTSLSDAVGILHTSNVP